MSAYGHDDLEDEEAELDRIAARDRDDDPRASLGFDAAPRPRRRPSGAPTVWAFVERDGNPAEHGGAVGGERRCRPPGGERGGCGEEASTLHADPRSSEPHRVLCPRCTGAIMRERMEGRR